MKTFRSVFLAIGMLASFSGAALAQVNNQLNPDTSDGAVITSNTDNSNGEQFTVNDSGVQVISADGNVATTVSNANNMVLNYDSDDSSAGTFAIQSGGSEVLSADNAGALTISGGTTVNNTLAIDTNGGGGGGTQLTVNAVGATTTSTNGNTVNALNNAGYSVTHFDGTATNAISVGATQQTSIGGNTFSYGTAIAGGALVQGDLGVNGSIYALNPTANTGINVGNNGLDIDGASNTTSLVADSNGSSGDGRGELTLQEDQASMVVYNQQTGAAHGLTINQTSTVLTGGTNSTSLTLNDAGATFANTTTGGPARVTGVADGTTRFDAVNFGQLTEVYGGIASVAAMANIPAPAPGKNFSIGLGYGNFEGESAFALGGAARLTDNVSVQASAGRSDDNHSFGAGVGFSW
jgi:hypothetical protein